MLTSCYIKCQFNLQNTCQWTQQNNTKRHMHNHNAKFLLPACDKFARVASPCRFAGFISVKLGVDPFNAARFCKPENKSFFKLYLLMPKFTILVLTLSYFNIFNILYIILFCMCQHIILFCIMLVVMENWVTKNQFLFNVGYLSFSTINFLY